MIVAANEACLATTELRRDLMVGRYVFDVFPDNPDDPEASGVANATASFNRVLSLRRPDIMPVQRHDVRAPGERGFVEKYWKPVNAPVLGADGKVKWILHSVEDVTELVSLKFRGSEDTPLRRTRRLIVDGLRAANGLLACLSLPLWEVLGEHLKPVALKRGTLITEPGQRAAVVYFPLSGLYSAAHHLEDGSAIEVGLGSRTGLIGASVLADGAPEHLETRCLIEGAALAIDADILRSILAVHPALRAHLSQIMPVLMAQMSMSAACAARHSVEQRLSLWLMRARDRVGSLDLEVSQETLSVLLGVRRTGVSEVLGRLGDAALVNTGRNVIVITDKPRLKWRACSCYDEAEGLRAAYAFARIRVDPATEARLPRLLQDYATIAREAGA
jgi:CRP-like cAMP-binding protein